MLYDLCRDTLRVATPATPDGLQAMVDVHGKVTGLFSEISDLEKRSLASKYLHFHEYIKFAEKATALAQFCEREYGPFMLSRQVDNLLLNANE